MMASKALRKLKNQHRRHRPLKMETKARLVKKPKDDGLRPGRLVAVAEYGHEKGRRLA